MSNDCINWTDLEFMGYTPAGVLKLVEGYSVLVANRKSVVETNNKYLEEVRCLRRELEAHVKREAENNNGV